VLASQIQQFLTVFTIGLSLARFWRAFRISVGAVGHPKPPLGTPLVLEIQVADSFQNVNKHLPQLQHITSEKTLIKYFLTFLKMYKLAGWAITELPVKILAHREGVQ